LKKQVLHILLILLAVFFLNNNSLTAQISMGGYAPSIKYKLSQYPVPIINLAPPDVNRLLEEDSYYEKDAMAMRFAEAIQSAINFAKEGLWEYLPDGGRLCRLTIQSEDAQALILYYSHFNIPAGGKLFLYNNSQNQVIGAFTSINNPKRQHFATEMIYGAEVTLEYHEPAGLTAKPDIIISEVGYVYRTADKFFQSRDFGDADTCEVNVRCPEGANWHLQKNGVTRIIVKSGSSSLWCTGSLINNTRMDFTPYFLTADHCGANATPQNYNQWIFYFRYESFDCEDMTSDTLFNTYTMIGATKRAASGGAGLASDFKLLELNQIVPPDKMPFFNGWSIADIPSPTGVTIHHPEGDVKKISTYTDTLISTNWGSIPNTHWEVFWSQTETNWGVTEPGSSGSPLFDEEGRIVGQLTGGTASCQALTSSDKYGKIAYSWAANSSSDTTMLRPWLDPDNTGTIFLDGLVSVAVMESSATPLRLFPNPTDGILFINDDRISGVKATVQIFNIMGIMALENEYAVNNNQITLDLGFLQKGIFFITIISNNTRLSAKVVR
jgi:hypothetical protein